MQNEIAGFRLSPQQKRLWSLQKDSRAYYAQCAILLEGDVKADRLKKAVCGIASQYEILRTTFRLLPGIRSPVQVISDEVRLSWQEVDLSGMGPRQQDVEIERLFQQEADHLFDFELGPLVRVSLIALFPRRQILLVSIPSLCADYSTLSNLADKISQAYAEGSDGIVPCDEPLQYITFSEWQNELIEDEESGGGKQYWRKQDFSGLLSLTLPYERRQQPMEGFKCAVVQLPPDPDLAAAVEATAGQHNAALPALLLSCWQTLISRLTQQPEIVVGVVFDGRTHDELQDAPGLFARAIPARAIFQDRTRFKEILSRLDELLGDAYDLQEYFVWDQISPAVDDDLSMPFFPFAFEFAKAFSPRVAAGVSFSIYKQHACVDRFKAKLFCAGGENSLAIELHYDAALFNEADIKCVAAEFDTLLKNAIAHPEAEVSSLEIVSEAERRRLLFEWNNTGAEFPLDQRAHRLFEAQVKRTPDNIAVEFDAEQISYLELNARANQLAYHLRSLGIGPDVPVGIFTERCPWMVIGIWAVLKAGGAYVPLDPIYPKDRLGFMLQDAGVQVLLTQSHLRERLPEHEAQVFCLDADWDALAEQSRCDPDYQTDAEHLAYVIYTSGSTGKPKGVMISHRGLVNYLSWAVEAYETAAGRGTLVSSPLGFDLTITSLFSPLMAGRTAVLMSDTQIVDGMSTVWRNAGHLSVIKITPAHLELLSVQLAAEEAGGVARALIIGGEALFYESLSFWRACAPQTRLINEYGPTETVVGCCVYEVSDEDGQSGPVPIGRPIANTRLYILDMNSWPGPTGVAGELYIGGSGLARGYLDRPDLTASRFVPDPFGGAAGARLYRTGDLARYLSDGNIEYLGRVDRQVKLRGFRIEPGEIEAVLAQHREIKETVVVVREDVAGDRRLVAYVVPAANASFTTDDLKRYAGEKLPDYMIPSLYVMLDELPLTLNGKIMRDALQAPEIVIGGNGDNFVGPRDAVELWLTRTWEEILKVKPVGVKDDFFRLGGHSMLAARLMARIQQRFGVGLPLATLFKQATIEHLANSVRQHTASASEPSTLVEIQPEGSRPPLFFVHPSGGNVLCYFELSRNLGADQPFYGLQSAGLIDGQPLYSSIEHMAAHYIEAIRGVQREGPYCLGGWSMGGVVAFEMARQLQSSGEQVSLLALIDATAPGSNDLPAIADELTLMATFAQDLGLSWEHLTISLEELMRLEPDEQLRYLLERAKAATVVPPDFDVVHIRRLFRVFKNNVQAMLSYVPQPYQGRVTLFRADKQIKDNPAGETMGWAAFALEGVEVHASPGNHFTVVREPDVKVLAEKLSDCLSRVEAVSAQASHSSSRLAGKTSGEKY